MACIVEICGSPGVGKSTIFDEIIRRKNRNGLWSTATIENPYEEQSRYDFIKKVYSEIGKGRKSKSDRYTNVESNYEFVRRIYKLIKNGKDHIEPILRKAAAERFVAEFPEYVDACLGNIFYRQGKNLNGLDLRFEKANFIYKIIKKIQVVRERNEDKITIIDEGLINLIDRALYKSTNPIEEQEEICRLLDVMPLPDALVYIQADLNENAKRLTLREDIRDMHKGLSVAELISCTKACRERIELTIKLLEERGIPVLYIDSKNQINSNAKKIIEFTEQMHKKSLSKVAQPQLA